MQYGRSIYKKKTGDFLHIKFGKVKAIWSQKKKKNASEITILIEIQPTKLVFQEVSSLLGEFLYC